MAESWGAGDCGKSGGVRACGLERGGFLAVKLEFYPRKRLAGVAGKSVNKGVLRCELPSKADVGELDDRLAGGWRAWACVIRVGLAGGFDEIGAEALVFGKNFIPTQGDDFGGVERVSERDFEVCHGWADDQRKGNGGGGGDRVLVGAISGEMPVTLECAHSVKSRDFLDSEVGAFQIKGEHPVFPGAIGELALVLGWEFKHRFEVPERDFLSERPVKNESDFGGERWLNGECVFLHS